MLTLYNRIISRRLGITKVCSSITENAVMGHRKAVLRLQRPEGRGHHEGNGITEPQSHSTTRLSAAGPQKPAPLT